MSHVSCFTLPNSQTPTLLLYLNILPWRVISSAITPTVSLVVDFLGAIHIAETEHSDDTYHFLL